MDFHETSECDRCGNAIVESVHSRPNPFQIVIQQDGEPNSYDAYQRNLCSGCEEELLNWIDEPDDDDFDARADLPRVDEVSKSLDSLGSELNDIADELAEANRQK